MGRKKSEKRMNTLQIGFCDDVPLMAEQLKNMVAEYLSKKDIEADYVILI